MTEKVNVLKYFIFTLFSHHFCFFFFFLNPSTASNINARGVHGNCFYVATFYLRRTQYLLDLGGELSAPRVFPRTSYAHKD